MIRKALNPPRRRGRPRAFDADAALEAAMRLFWRQGYEGTSLAALTDAMGLSAPSLYAAFGNKAALFQAALDRYVRRPASYLGTALLEPTARGAIEKLFASAIDMVTDGTNPDGCLLVHGALAAGPTAEAARAALAGTRAAAEAAVRRRFERAAAAGDLPGSADPARLARFVVTVLWGMSVQAASGATRQDLADVAATAMLAWPG